jgi:hypothetical protein
MIAGKYDVIAYCEQNPLNPWPKDPRLKELGNWGLLASLEGVEPYSLALLTRVLGWDRPKIEVLSAEVRADLKNRRIHAYTLL